MMGDDKREFVELKASWKRSVTKIQGITEIVSMRTPLTNSEEHLQPALCIS